MKCVLGTGNRVNIKPSGMKVKIIIPVAFIVVHLEEAAGSRS